MGASDLDVRAPAATGLVSGLLEAMRPRQWAKNVLVLAAPLASGFIDEGDNLVNALVAFVAFCMASSGTYLWNDVHDAEADRAHPDKRHRPIARGSVPPGVAVTIGVILVAGAIGVSFVAAWQLAVTTGAYVACTTLYTLALKDVVVFDVVAIASGFVLRALAGGTATGILISDWFFIMACFGSLLIVTGKRAGEALQLGHGAGAVRSTLGEYTSTYLGYLRAVSSGVLLVAYCLWAFEKAAVAETDVPLYQITILPFALGVLRYALLIEEGKGAAPEEVIFRDRPLLLVGVAWAALFGAAVYAL